MIDFHMELFGVKDVESVALALYEAADLIRQGKKVSDFHGQGIKEGSFELTGSENEKEPYDDQ